MTIRGATAHNLAGLDVDIPANGLIAVTGVSGSGKSSLVFDVLAPSLERAIDGGGAAHRTEPIGCRELAAHVPFRRVVRVGLLAAPASPRSSPATWLGFFDDLRGLFAATARARALGLTRRHFSLETPGGRCEGCEGTGQTRVSMDFLPDVWVPCEECEGRRFDASVLACTLDGGVSIADLLDLPAERAREVLAAARSSRVPAALDALVDAGLGYVPLGQPVRTLSGGERQRLVLAAALAGGEACPAIFLFEEPTTGLHADDVDLLLGVFERLVRAGHTLVVIEHNLDVVRAADWVIDLGPEGGRAGGRLVVAGPPAAVAAHPGSHTGRALRLNG